MIPTEDWAAMKDSQRDDIADVIVTAGIALTTHGSHKIWRDTMKRQSGRHMGRVRRFYACMANFDDKQVDDFLRVFLL